MFKRLLVRKRSSETGSSDSVPKSGSSTGLPIVAPTVAINEIGVQVEIPVKTVGTLTSWVPTSEAATITENLSAVDATTSPEIMSFADQYVQCSSTCMDAGVDPGDWNYGIFRGIDCQTDSPDLSDPLLWITGSFDDTRNLFSNLIARLEQEEFGTSSSEKSLEILKLQADNVLLRIELNNLKRKLKTYDAIPEPRRSEDTRKIQRETLSALVGRNKLSVPFTVTNESGVTVTTNLAPSSPPLGTLRKGDRILLSGHPEEISGLVRAPVLPRGWVTLRDNSRIYMTKSA